MNLKLKFLFALIMVAFAPLSVFGLGCGDTGKNITGIDGKKYGCNCTSGSMDYRVGPKFVVITSSSVYPYAPNCADAKDCNNCWANASNIPRMCSGWKNVSTSQNVVGVWNGGNGSTMCWTWRCKNDNYEMTSAGAMGDGCVEKTQTCPNKPNVPNGVWAPDSASIGVTKTCTYNNDSGLSCGPGYKKSGSGGAAACVEDTGSGDVELVLPEASSLTRKIPASAFTDCGLISSSQVDFESCIFSRAKGDSGKIVDFVLDEKSASASMFNLSQEELNRIMQNFSLQ